MRKGGQSAAFLCVLFSLPSELFSDGFFTCCYFLGGSGHTQLVGFASPTQTLG